MRPPPPTLCTTTTTTTTTPPHRRKKKKKNKIFRTRRWTSENFGPIFDFSMLRFGAIFTGIDSFGQPPKPKPQNHTQQVGGRA
jgi:hypothetical protein